MPAVNLMPRLPATAGAVIDAVLAEGERRVLLYGEPGSGKSTLAAGLAAALAVRNRACACISGDPGSPAFGIPGTVALARWQDRSWQVLAMEALCSLDAGRFRLPLIAAVRRLLMQDHPGNLFIDGPGVVRGVAGAELLLALAEVGAVEDILCVTHHFSAPPLAQELLASGCRLWIVAAAEEARRPGKRQRARRRTEQWEAYLNGGEILRLDLDGLPVVGTPPPREMEAAWVGRQVGLLDASRRTLAMGEIVDRQGSQLEIRCAAITAAPAYLLVRDVVRNARNELETAQPAADRVGWYRPPPDMFTRGNKDGDDGPQPVATLGTGSAMLVNGVFGDPLLHLRLRHRRRSLLFDLGESERLPTRLAHQVSDVLITHAHIDHIMGFLRLLRSRIGVDEVCRLYGPPGLLKHIQGMIQGVHWDRIGDRGPRFEVHELHDDVLLQYRLQVGRDHAETLGRHSIADGVLRSESDFLIRATTLDHGIPVLAYSYETPQVLKIRKDRLTALGLVPGPWLTELKGRINEGAADALIDLPDGRAVPTRTLDEQLVLRKPGQKLAYATDLADTPSNRERLIQLAQGANTFICEAAFREADADQARRTGHLTARASGEIASAARVQTFIPFHFSQRYADDPTGIYDEVRSACACAMLPPIRDR